MLQLLELFGGIGSPRASLKKMGIKVKAIDYVETDPLAVHSYNAMFADELSYKTQSVVDWDLRPDVLVHGSPCQDISIAGLHKGADKDSHTRSSLMWETIRIIQQLGEWRPKIVIWENVKGLLHKPMIKNFNQYLLEMERLGYTNSYEILDARDFGLPQARQRVFTISVLNGIAFNFKLLKKKPMKDIREFLESNCEVDDVYTVTQPSILSVIGKKGIKRATIIEDFAYTITTRQDRSPAQIIDCGDRYRYLTELECWRLQGYSDNDYFKAAAVHKRRGRFIMPLYKQSGNSIPVDIFESIFEAIL